MRLKSFFADTIEEALSLARREMGSEAMLVNSKRSHGEAQHLGAYEVVVCGESSRPTDEARETSRTASAAAPPQADRLSRDISDLKHQVERLARSLARSGSGPAGIASNPNLSAAFGRLTDAELDADLAYEVISKIGSNYTLGALRAELARLVSVDAELGLPGAISRIVALIGPPGAGKTSSLVKLAVQYGVTARKPTYILSLDIYRVAAADELRSYAAIMGIGCQVLETAGALAQALEEHRQKHLILIDTPGLSSAEMEGHQDLARLLATYPGVDTHLVLSASMRTTDLRRVADQYSPFKPGKLLFTRLDETRTFGPIASQSVRMGIPLSFVSRGQRIPEDLEPATKDLILGAMLDATAGSEAGGETRVGVAAA
jgi:flagellar biosynthesis protein FlhF